MLALTVHAGVIRTRVAVITVKGSICALTIYTGIAGAGIIVITINRSVETSVRTALIGSA